MFHNIVSSSMDYSNRMTVLMGYASQRSTAVTIGRNMEEARPIRACQRKQNAAEKLGQERHQGNAAN